MEAMASMIATCRERVSDLILGTHIGSLQGGKQCTADPTAKACLAGFKLLLHSPPVSQPACAAHASLLGQFHILTWLL